MPGRSPLDLKPPVPKATGPGTKRAADPISTYLSQFSKEWRRASLILHPKKSPQAKESSAPQASMVKTGRGGGEKERPLLDLWLRTILPRIVLFDLFRPESFNFILFFNSESETRCLAICQTSARSHAPPLRAPAPQTEATYQKHSLEAYAGINWAEKSGSE